ncbi:MAG: amidohydrolase family protein [Bacteroidales bacterium]|nr:amidohydrolase family protein [Bacteroidales bacterium]
MAAAWTLTARWLLTGDGPPLEHGTITIREDRIETIATAGPHTPDVDLGNSVIVPGFVNAHTHLDLSGACGATPPTTAAAFPDWLRSVIAFRRTRSDADVATDIITGLNACLQAGTTLLGDIAASGASWPTLADAPVRAVVFREMLGLSDLRSMVAFRESSEWLQVTHPTATCRPGLSPHAPYSTSVWLFLTALSAEVPVMTHLAESAAEVELLECRSGPFVAFLQELGVWEPDALAVSVGEFPLLARQVRATLQPAPPLLFAHGNHLSPDLPLADEQTTIVYCPRTQAAFGHPPYPLREFLAHGVRVCLGTDSLASNPDLDILEEARFVRRLFPDLSGETILRMVTLSGAEALGWADTTGSLTPGKSADLVVLPIAESDAGTDPYASLWGSDLPRRTLFRGEWR